MTVQLTFEIGVMVLRFNFSAQLVSVLLAATSGVMMALQGSLNASLGKVIGLLETTFVVHFIGVVILMVLLFVFKIGQGNLSLWQDAPWYTYLGGVISVFIIYLVAASIPNIGVCNATTAIIVGQVLTAMLIDYFGLFGLEKMQFAWQQFIGVFLLALGAKLLLKGL